MADFDFDLFVIGGGSGGVRGARWAAPKGAKVAICEEDRYGGTCVLRGCIPKKMMVYAGRVQGQADLAKNYGFDISINSHNWNSFREAREKELSRLSGLYQQTLNNNKVTVLNGRGIIKGPNTIEVAGKTYTSKYILVAVGGVPWKRSFSGSEHSINSNQFFELKERPDRVLIEGGGFIAVEFACLLQGLGSEVHIVIRRDEVLRGFDNECRTFLQDQMKEAGINFHLNTTIEEVKKDSSGVLDCRLKNGESISVDQLICATGRAPNTKNLGIEDTAVELNKDGAIVVDAYSQTTCPSIYAVGDVTNRMNLTPVALEEAMLVVNQLFSQEEKSMTYSNIASAVFSTPPLATVGLTEEEAIAELGDQEKIEVYTSNFRALKYTLGTINKRSFMKMIVNIETQKVIGLHMVGDDAPEIMQGFAVAIKAGITKKDFDQTIGIHPTSAEEFVTMRTPRS